MGKKTKEIKVYPYFFTDIQINEASTWREKFSRENIIKNVLGYGENAFCLIVDKRTEDNPNLIFLRFLKLKAEIPKIINKTTGEEKEITINYIEESIIYTTHMLLDLENKMIFSEYNHNAARHINTNFSYYINKMFELEDLAFDIITLKNYETLEEMKKEEVLKSVNMRVKAGNLKKREQGQFLPLLGAIKDYGEDENFEIEIKIKKTRGSKNLNRDSIEKFVLENKDETNEDHKKLLETLRVESENTIYDLLNNNLRYYFTDHIDLEKGAPSPNQVFNELKRLYSEKKQTLLNNYQN